MLCLNNLKIKIDDRILFSNLSVTLAPGSITYFTGKNGAGKTTLLKILAGLKKPTDGEILIYDHKIEDLAKPFCLYIGHNSGIESDIKVIDQIEFWAKSYNSPELIQPAIHYWDLYEYLESDISSLSAGNAKKVSLCKLMCCHADIWLLDEAEVNLDENNLKFLHHAITAKAENGGIIIITTNQKAKIEKSQTIDLGDFT